MRRKFLLVSLLALLLSGCVVAVMAGAAGSLIVYDGRSLRMMEKDARIFHVVHTKLVTDPSFHGSRIVVTSFQQVVLLSGQVPYESLREAAGKIATNTPNVRRVYNQLTIGPLVSIRQQSQDTWITSEVRTHMLAQGELESGSVRVITEDGVVYLMGIVTPEQAILAANTARRIKGVKQVVKVFQYVR